MIPVSEATRQRTVVDAAHTFAWRTMSVRATEGRRDGQRAWQTATSCDGWPDVLAWHPKYDRILAIELKSERGRLTDAQRDVLVSLSAAGMETAVWRPRHWVAVWAVLRATRPVVVCSTCKRVQALEPPGASDDAPGGDVGSKEPDFAPDAVLSLIDEPVFVRTVTLYYTGRLVAVDDHWLCLTEAAWIPHTGRWSNTLTGTAKPTEVEPYPADLVVRIARGAVVEVSPWGLVLPREQV